jgi:aarF domain-containing kinase
VKFGQGIAAMDHLLPPPFYKHMSKLQDKAKSAPYAQIAKLFKDEVGTSIEDTFSTFDKEPVASASLAQVHKATLKDGTSVAVKIQKPNIKGQFSSDMVMHYLINFVLEKAFELPLLHFVEDVQKNLRKELDFRIEASNSELSEKNFKLLSMFFAKNVDRN